MSDPITFADWLAITNVKARYCRLLDTKDWEGFAALFTEDFELDVSASGGNTSVIVGRSEALARIRMSIEDAKTVHQIHSPEITLKGDTAHVIWAMYDRISWSPERPSLSGYGHYHERYVRVRGEWKIASSRLTRLHIDIQPGIKTNDTSL